LWPSYTGVEDKVIVHSGSLQGDHVHYIPLYAGQLNNKHEGRFLWSCSGTVIQVWLYALFLIVCFLFINMIILSLPLSVYCLLELSLLAHKRYERTRERARSPSDQSTAILLRLHFCPGQKICGFAGLRDCGLNCFDSMYQQHTFHNDFSSDHRLPCLIACYESYNKVAMFEVNVWHLLCLTESGFVEHSAIVSKVPCIPGGFSWALSRELNVKEEFLVIRYSLTTKGCHKFVYILESEVPGPRIQPIVPGQELNPHPRSNLEATIDFKATIDL